MSEKQMATVIERPHWSSRCNRCDVWVCGFTTKREDAERLAEAHNAAYHPPAGSQGTDAP